MKNKIFLSFLLVLFSFYHMEAQENTGKKDHGTIKIQKKGQLAKVQFDNVNYRLVGIDQYGNVLDSAVVEFQLSVTIKGIFYTENTVGPGLTYQMQQLLGRCDRSSKIIFENIKAKDRNGEIVMMPSFGYLFGYSDEAND